MAYGLKASSCHPLKKNTKYWILLSIKNLKLFFQTENSFKYIYVQNMTLWYLFFYVYIV